MPFPIIVTALVIAWIITSIKTLTGISSNQKESQIASLIQQWLAQGTPTDNITEGLRQADYSEADITKVFQKLFPDEATAEQQLKGANPEEAAKLIEDLAAKGTVSPDSVNKWWQQFVTQPTLPFDESVAERQLSVATPEEAQKLIEDWAAQGAPEEEAENFQQLVNNWWLKYVTGIAGAQQKLIGKGVEEANKLIEDWAIKGTFSDQQLPDLKTWYKEQIALKPYQEEAVRKFLEMGRTDLAEQTLAHLPKDIADQYMQWGQYKVGLEKTATLSQREQQRKARAQQFWGQTTGRQRIDFYKGYDPSTGPPTRPPSEGSFENEEEEAQMHEAYRKAKGKWNKELEKVSEWARPRMPAEAQVAHPIIEQLGGGMASGTRLRDFLEGQFVSQIAGETRGARQSWWNRMYPELLPRKEQTGDLARIAQRTWERSPEYQALSRQEPRIEETESHRGGILAKREYKKEMADWQAQLAQAKGTWQEDPFVRALRERGKQFRPAYFRQPGAGLAPLLTPSVKF